MRSADVEEPFHSDDRFWRSVAASLLALVTIIAATAVTAFVGRWGVLVFVVPLALLVMAGRDARASTALSRPTFQTRADWRAAERRAVAAALVRGARRTRRR